MTTAKRDIPVEELGWLLRWGVITATVTVLIGGVLLCSRHGDLSKAEFKDFRGEPADLKSLAGIVQNTALGDPRAIIQLGILLLVATPVARVIVAGFAFAKSRDWLYVGVSVIVSALLFWSLLYG